MNPNDLDPSYNRKNMVNVTFAFNKKHSDFRKIICLRKPEASFEIKNQFEVIEKSEENGIHEMPCPYTNDVIDLLPKQL